MAGKPRLRMSRHGGLGVAGKAGLGPLGEARPPGQGKKTRVFSVMDLEKTRVFSVDG